MHCTQTCEHAHACAYTYTHVLMLSSVYRTLESGMQSLAREPLLLAKTHWNEEDFLGLPSWTLSFLQQHQRCMLHPPFSFHHNASLGRIQAAFNEIHHQKNNCSLLLPPTISLSKAEGKLKKSKIEAWGLHFKRDLLTQHAKSEFPFLCKSTSLSELWTKGGIFCHVWCLL